MQNEVYVDMVKNHFQLTKKLTVDTYSSNFLLTCSLN